MVLITPYDCSVELLLSIRFHLERNCYFTFDILRCCCKWGVVEMQRRRFLRMPMFRLKVGFCLGGRGKQSRREAKQRLPELGSMKKMV
jgi:hypothetical protein